MEWLRLCFALFIGYGIINRFHAAKLMQYQARQELQWWEADLGDDMDTARAEMRVHFPSMLMRWRNSDIDHVDLT